MSSTTSNYSKEQETKCIARITELSKSMPEFCQKYLMHCATKTSSAYRTGLQYTYEIRIFISYIAEKNNVQPDQVTPAMLESLTTTDINTYITELTKYTGHYFPACDLESKKEPGSKRTGKHAAARARNLAAVRGLYKSLLDDKKITQNPAKAATTPSEGDKGVIVMTTDEINDMMRRIENVDLPGRSAMFSKDSCRRDKALITLLLYTGIRASECAGINLDDIGWTSNSLKIDRKGKEGKNQKVYFNDEVATLLHEYIDNERKPADNKEQALFIGRFGERLSPQSINKIVKKYANGISAQKITTHKLRSSYATQLYKETRDAMLVKDALGHKSLGVVQKYVATADENRQIAARKITYHTKEQE